MNYWAHAWCSKPKQVKYEFCIVRKLWTTDVSLKILYLSNLLHWCITHSFTSVCQKLYDIAEYFKNGHCLYYNSRLSPSQNDCGQWVIIREADLVTAHEFGHRWGSEHDPDTLEYSPSVQVEADPTICTHTVVVDMTRIIRSIELNVN
jgi:hypothetical protein